MKTPLMLDTKRLAIHDGPGIRTTFFVKGCPLHCVWCHNPESIRAEAQWARFQHLCQHCAKCMMDEGEISDIDIDGLHADKTHRGVRILSTGAPIRNVTVRNVHISTYRNLVALTHFFPDRKARGVFDNITIRDSSVSAAPQPKELDQKYRAWPMIWVEQGCDVGQLVIDNIVRRETYSAEDPTIGIESGAKIDKLVVTNCRQVNETSGELIFLSQEGEVGILEQ